ncbi:MAG: hypothetical protein QM662_11650 [Gordonia sp. (in: high G+C Gram-positive bacteria)]
MGNDRLGGAADGIVLPAFLTTDLELVTVRVRRVPGGFAIDEARDVDGRTTWVLRWTWRTVDLPSPDRARTVGLADVAGILADLLADGCTIEQITTVTGCWWPRRRLDDDGLDGLHAACSGDGWVLWPHPVDPAAPTGDVGWRVTTGLDGVRFAIGEDRPVFRLGVAEIELAPPPMRLYRFDGIESRYGEPQPVGWSCRPILGFDPAVAEDRSRLITLLRNWISLDELVKMTEHQPVTALPDPERCGSGLDGVCAGTRFIDVDGPRAALRFAIRHTVDGWDLDVDVDGVAHTVHSWRAVDPRGAIGSRTRGSGVETCLGVAAAVEAAVRGGATLGEVLGFTQDVWPLWRYPGMLDGFAQACVGDAWCWWPTPPFPSATAREVGLWRVTTVGDVRYTADTMQWVTWLGGVAAAEILTDSKAAVVVKDNSAGGRIRCVQMLEDFRPDKPGHWDELLTAVRSGVLTDVRTGVVACGEFTTLVVGSE